MVVTRQGTELSEETAFKLAEAIHKDEMWAGGPYIEHIRRGLLLIPREKPWVRIVWILHDAFESSKERKGRAAEYSFEDFVTEFNPPTQIANGIAIMRKPDGALYFDEYLLPRVKLPVFRKLKEIDNAVNSAQIDPAHMSDHGVKRRGSKTRITHRILKVARTVFDFSDASETSGGFSLQELWNDAQNESEHLRLYEMINQLDTSNNPRLDKKAKTAREIIVVNQMAKDWQRSFQSDRVHDRIRNGPPAFLGGVEHRVGPEDTSGFVREISLGLPTDNLLPASSVRRAS